METPWPPGFGKETPLITPDDALDIVLKRVRPLQAIRKPLAEAAGYCLAEEVRTDRDMPPADRSAMDGYAVRSSDLAKCPSTLRVAGEVAAGSPGRPKVGPGTCVRVLTGANIPPGADAVVMIEQTKEADGVVTFLAPVAAGSNIRRRAEESNKGDVLLAKGTVLDAVQIGLCAAVGKAEVRIHRRPRVAVLCTGEELREAGARVQPHEVRDSNGPALCAALSAWGCVDVVHQVVPDEVRLLSAKLKPAAARHDVVLLTGGVSVGKYDYVPESVERIGATVHFHGVAMKPGKPVLYATLPGCRHIFGLPGNPVSVMTAFYEFGLPALRRMSGLAAKQCRPSVNLPLAGPVKSKGGRVQFMLARLSWTDKGPSAIPLKSHGSADLAAGRQADGVIVVPLHVAEMAAGSLVQFRPWRPLP